MLSRFILFQHVAGLYISGRKERCYLAKDLDQYFPNVVNLQTFLESGKVRVIYIYIYIYHITCINLYISVSNQFM